MLNTFKTKAKAQLELKLFGSYWNYKPNDFNSSCAFAFVFNE